MSISEGYVDLSVLISDGRPTIRIAADTMSGAKFVADYPLDEDTMAEVNRAYVEAERIVEDEWNRSSSSGGK
jgi:uncharacterized protein with von Willebrand factor type A (vWA) domain